MADPGKSGSAVMYRGRPWPTKDARHGVACKFLQRGWSERSPKTASGQWVTLLVVVLPVRAVQDRAGVALDIQRVRDRASTSVRIFYTYHKLIGSGQNTGRQ